MYGAKCEASIQKCTCSHFSCSKLPDHPVCGSDGHTYPTECHLLDDQCRYQRPILLAAHSPCRGKTNRNLFGRSQKAKSLLFRPRFDPVSWKAYPCLGLGWIIRKGHDLEKFENDLLNVGSLPGSVSSFSH